MIVDMIEGHREEMIREMDGSEVDDTPLFRVGGVGVSAGTALE